MRNRAVGLARRLVHSRHAAPALSALTLPYRLDGPGPNPVVAEHYGMRLGRRFDSDDDAARHYFSEGWKLGLVPHPFLDLPAARFSRVATLRLRNALAQLTWTGTTSAVLGSPSRFLPQTFGSELVGRPGGWLAELVRRTHQEDVPVLVGLYKTTWTAYLANCRELTEAAARVYESTLLDQPFYESQLGGARFRSPQAALDDYLANGEFDGRTPHPFFEPEWYEIADRSQVRRGRPVSQLLDFVARGEFGQASPHFWGQRYLESLGDAERPVSLLAHFTEHAPPDAPTPAVDDVLPMPRAVAEDRVRTRVADYHADLGRLWAGGPLLPQHLPATGAPAADATCLVVVDERHLVSADAVSGLAGVAAQRVRGLRIAVVEGDDTARRADLDALVDDSPAIDVVQRRGGEPLGAVVRRLIDESGPHGWALWAAGQRWEPDFLASAVGALREHPQARAAAAVSASTPQPWLRTPDAVWLDGLDGAGVVFRADDEPVLPDSRLDVGIVTDLLIGLAATAPCAVLDQPLVVAEESADITTHERRAAANAGRGQHLLRFGAPEVEVGIAIPTYEDWVMTLIAVRKALENSGDHQLRVCVVDNGSRRPVTSILAACFAADDRVVVRRLPRNTDFALGSNLAAAEAAGRTTVFLNNDTAAHPGWLGPLLEALDAGAAAAQPLLLYGDRTVQTAGTVFFGGLSMPAHLLAGVQPIDVDPAIDEYEFSALTGACLAVRQDAVAALGGFDPQYVNGMEDIDFCFRLREHTGAPLRVRTAARVVHFESRSAGRSTHHDANRARFAQRWHTAIRDLDDTAAYRTGPVALDAVRWSRWPTSPLWVPHPQLRSRREPISVDEPKPRLRWAIKSSATGDPSGDTWGDTFFADSLAGALRKAGQQVVIDRSSSHQRESASWDDVTLALRGLARYVPQPGAVNLLWVISHPDLVTRYELSSGFARVYAAGARWAQQASDRWGVEVRTLLQATDATKFHPGVDLGARRRGVLFVGRTRGVPRVVVNDVIAAGGEPEVYGDDGWEQFIEPRFIKGIGIANDDVPAAYGAAAIVLNDHWADMAAQGFYSNRLFDAAATGARIISDHVAGMEDIFGPQVQGYARPERLAELLDPHAPHWPDEDELGRLAQTIVAEHSFDARARVLLDDALEARRERG